MQSPDAQLPLNGPIAIHGNRIVAGGIVAIESQWRCAAFLSKGASSIERRSQLLPGPGTRCDLKRSTIDCVYLNGALVLEARDGVVDLSNTRGRYGLITNAAAVDFDDVRVTQP